jgi:hypothetical protein
VLKLRALFKDFFDGAATDKQVKETAAQVNTAKAVIKDEESGIELKPFKQDIYASLKKFKFKEVKEKRKAYAAVVKRKEKLDAAVILIDELNKFSTPIFKLKTALAGKYAQIPFSGLGLADESFLTEANAMPFGTKEEQKFKRTSLSFAKKVAKTTQNVNKFYPSGVAEYDMQILNNALDMPYDTKELAKTRAAAIKVEEKKLNLYNKVLEHYLEAKQLLAQMDNFSKWAEIEAKAQEIALKEKEQEAAAEAEKQAAAEQEAAAALIEEVIKDGEHHES